MQATAQEIVTLGAGVIALVFVFAIAWKFTEEIAPALKDLKSASRNGAMQSTAIIAATQELTKAIDTLNLTMQGLYDDFDKHDERARRLEVSAAIVLEKLDNVERRVN